MRTTITSTSDPAVVEVRLSDAPVKYEYTGDVIADVNRIGNWVRGLELLGSGDQFSLQQALAAFAPKPSAASVRRPQSELTVTYDKEADAGFLYLPYASAASVEREMQSNPLLLKCSHSVEDEKAVFGMTGDKSLASIRFVVPSDHQLDTFLHLFGNKVLSSEKK
jgi:hypothetical protein